jgi:hypothetical protein
MEKTFVNPKDIYPYPSRFGSHNSMVVLPVDIEDESINGQPGVVCCKDEFGTYITEISRLDNGRADPNRYKTSRLTSLFQRAKV